MPWDLCVARHRREICDETLFEVVIAWHRVTFAAFLAQPHSEASVLHVDILDGHSERRADAGEGIGHQRDRRGSRRPATVPSSMLSSSARASAGSSTGVCPPVTTCRRPRHRVGRVDRHDLAVPQPYEEVAQHRRQLLDRGRGQLARRRLNRKFPRPPGPVCGLRTFAAKNSRKRIATRSPAVATSAGRSGRADRDQLVHVVSPAVASVGCHPSHKSFRLTRSKANL